MVTRADRVKAACAAISVALAACGGGREQADTVEAREPAPAPSVESLGPVAPAAAMLPGAASASVTTRANIVELAAVATGAPPLARN